MAGTRPETGRHPQPPPVLPEHDHRPHLGQGSAVHPSLHSAVLPHRGGGQLHTVGRIRGQQEEEEECQREQLVAEARCGVGVCAKATTESGL